MSTRRHGWKTAVGLVLVGLMLFPVYWMINVSFTHRGSIRKSELLPFDFTTEHYQVALSQQLPYLGTSIVVGLGTVLLTLVIAAPAGFGIAKLPLPGGRVLSFLLIVAQMIPAVVMSLGFYTIYVKVGLLNSIPGLILADSTIAVPFATMLFAAFMRGIPRELMEAAMLDRASYWRTFVSVVLPVSKNVAITVGLFAFLWAWSDFIFASTLNREGGTTSPITMGIYHYISAQNQEWGPMMATAVLASIPTAMLLILAQKYVAAGVTAGSVKE
jgi:multiple sugar transport system permease protein